VVDVNGPEELFIPLPEKDSSGKSFMLIPNWLKEYQGKMSQFFPEKEEKSESMSSLHLITRSFDLLQDRFCELLIEKYPVDVRVRLSRKQAGTLEFHRAAELVEIGRLKTRKALDQLDHGNQ
jgi:NTE family protein